ncbi:MAG: DUF4041 domain-containing protein [Phycisphaeraceae bacterium]
MTTGLISACVALFCLSVLFAILFFKAKADCGRLRRELKRFREIADLEQHTNDQTAKAKAALAETARAQSELEQLGGKIAAQAAILASQDSQIAGQQSQLASVAEILGAYKALGDIKNQIEKQKRVVNQYNDVLGNFKTAEALRAHIGEQQSRVGELKQTIGKFDSISDLDRQVAAQQAQVRVLEARIKELDEVLCGADTASALHARIKGQQDLLSGLQAQAKQVEEALEMQEFGFYRPRYDFASSTRYQEKLDQVREAQSTMIKGEHAVKWDKTWSVEGSEAKGRKMMSEQTKLMLRAFNGECDAAVARVKYNNATTLENRINRSYEQINKLGKTNSSGIADGFLQLKLEELHLVHEHRVKQQQEKEEQQRIRDLMREEEKAQREIEEAEQEAAKEEAAAERALDRARRTFEEATRGQLEATEQTREQNAALAAQVAKLENELTEAIDRKAKAIARAQLTKSGYLYVLSNIGSFGDDLYKLGMTRRLDPLERVKELGDASVPFPFDVHAVIFSENAPELECKLHRHFADRRVNLVNMRREYFRVTLEEIIVAVAEYFGEITFVRIPEAAEYRETEAKRKASGLPQLPCVEVGRTGKRAITD